VTLDAHVVVTTLRASSRSRAWAIVGALSITETVSWGILYYAFAVFLVPMQRDLGYSTAQLTGAFSAALLVSGVAGIGVGRYLDRHSPRALMTGGSVTAALLVAAWSQVHGLAAFYVLWIAIGAVMATVLYEPAFIVLAKWFPAASERRQAMTAMTPVAALASFIFLPFTQVLIEAGDRGAAIVKVLAALDRVPSGLADRDRHDRATPSRSSCSAGTPPASPPSPSAWSVYRRSRAACCSRRSPGAFPGRRQPPDSSR